jgi:hypothetical protein
MKQLPCTLKISTDDDEIKGALGLTSKTTFESSLPRTFIEGGSVTPIGIIRPLVHRLTLSKKVGNALIDETSHRISIVIVQKEDAIHVDYSIHKKGASKGGSRKRSSSKRSSTRKN